MKHLFFSLLFCSASLYASDWRVELYDKAQDVQRVVIRSKWKHFDQLDPKQADFHKIFFRKSERGLSINRIGFFYLLEKDPKRIDWKNPYSWSSTMLSIPEWEREKIAQHSAELQKLFKQNEADESLLKQDNNGFDKFIELSERHESELKSLSEYQRKEFLSLQAQVEKHLKAQQGAAANP